MIVTPIDIANRWRKANGYAGRGGVVVVFTGEVQSWVNQVRNPEHWQLDNVKQDGRSCCLTE